MDEEKYMPKDEDLSSSLNNTVKNSIMPCLKDLGVVLCVIFVLFLFCFRLAIVDGPSMNDTLVDGDLVLLVNSAISGDIKQGDIVVVNMDSYPAPIIKRVIATEGQTVEIDEDGTVRVDGIILSESYAKYEKNNKSYSNTATSFYVEKGCVFVMGDNRDNSLDSRNPRIGLVDCREIVGKAVFLISPGNNEGEQDRDFGRIGAFSK